MNSGATARTLLEITAKVFGHHVGNGLPSGRKILAQQLNWSRILDYNPAPVHKPNPYIRDELHEDPDDIYWRRSAELQRRKGRGAPKKGSGKRGKKK